MKQTFQNYAGVLALRRPRLVIGALALSVLGDGAARIALLLRVHDSGAGSAGLAVVLVLFALPVVLLVGVSGALADRPDPRRILIGAATIQALAAAGLAWRTDLVSTGIGAVALQVGFALGNATWVVALPRLVAAEQVGPLVSLHHAALGVATPLGAGLGGVLVEHADDRVPFVLNALTFVPLALAALLLRPASPTEGIAAAPRGLLRNLVPIDGVNALRRHPMLAVLTWAVLPFIVALESVNAIEVFLVKDVLGGSSSEYGAAEAAAGIAAVVGALLAATARSTRTRALTVVGALGVISTCQIGQGLAPHLAVYIPLAATVGLLLGAVNALILTLMVTATDARGRGSIVAFVGGASRSCGILALGVGGLLGSVLGPRSAYVVVGVVGLVIAGAAVLAVRGRFVDRRDSSPGRSPFADRVARADCGHVSDDRDGPRPRQRSGGGAAPECGALPGQDRDHRRGHPADLR